MDATCDVLTGLRWSPVVLCTGSCNGFAEADLDSPAFFIAWYFVSLNTFRKNLLTKNENKLSLVVFAHVLEILVLSADTKYLSIAIHPL